MTKKALILEAWYSKPDSNWYPWLKSELEKKGYEVYIPDLPDQQTDHPSLAKQLKFISNLLKIDKDTVVIGHSLGAVLGMRLGEKYKFKKLITVAGWDYNGLCEGHKLFWKTMMNHKKIKQNVKEKFCIASDNDPYYTAIAFEDTANRLGGKFVLIKGRGHFGSKEKTKKIPELLKFID